MSPLLLLLLAVPVAFGLMISDAVMSFVEDLEEATALRREIEDDADNGDPMVQEAGTSVPDGTLDLFDLLPVLSGNGQVQAVGNAQDDLLVPVIKPEATPPLESETDSDLEVIAEFDADVTQRSIGLEREVDQLALVVEEAQAGAAHSVLADLMLRYDSDADATTLDAGDHVLMSLVGDQTALSLALQTTQMDGASHWVDVDGQHLSAAEVAAADLLLIVCQYGAQPQDLVA